MQPELVCYYHTVAGFLTKLTWVAAIKNRQFALWLGLTAKAVTTHFPELEETKKRTQQQDTKCPLLYKEYSRWRHIQ
jgi:hypothetical protein